VFGGISIFSFKPNAFELDQWTFATRATWTGSTWRLDDGWQRRIGSNGTVDYQPFSRRDWRELDDPEYFKKEVRTTSQMSYPELKRYLTNLQQSGFDVSALMVDLYRKLSFFTASASVLPWVSSTGPRSNSSTSLAESTGFHRLLPPGSPT
jgi:lipopolysaccharide export LptBFGC system permease protein LptF